MTDEKYKEIFNRDVESIDELSKTMSPQELKEKLAAEIVEIEKQMIDVHQTSRARISARRKYLLDVDGAAILDRKLKEGKITYSDFVGDMTEEQIKNRELALEGREPARKQNEAWKTAVLAVRRLPGMTPEAVFAMLKPAHPGLTIEAIRSVWGR